jgi:alpha-1,3-glucosyltransferase
MCFCSYWAANIWSLYNVADKALAKAGKASGAWPVAETSAAMTGGLVTDEQVYAVLPEISPTVTIGLSVLSFLPPLWMLWNKPTSDEFVKVRRRVFSSPR